MTYDDWKTTDPRECDPSLWRETAEEEAYEEASFATDEELDFASLAATLFGEPAEPPVETFERALWKARYVRGLEAA